MRREPPDAAEKAWNPYSWRLREIAAHGDDPARAGRCSQLAAEVLVAEADEVAQGVRHVSVVHGDPPTVHEAEQLDTFLTQVASISEAAGWSRRRGDSEHIIVAVNGDDAEERIDQLAGLAEFSNPGHWQITKSARPDLTPDPRATRPAVAADLGGRLQRNGLGDGPGQCGWQRTSWRRP